MHTKDEKSYVLPMDNEIIKDGSIVDIFYSGYMLITTWCHAGGSQLYVIEAIKLHVGVVRQYIKCTYARDGCHCHYRQQEWHEEGLYACW